MSSADAAPHIVHLSSVHRVDDVRIFLKECRSLAAAGYRVTLIARGDASDSIDGVERIAVGTKNSAGRLGRMMIGTFNVARKAWGENADLYHFHDPELIPFGLLLKLRGVPVIYDVHESVSKQILSKPWIPLPLRRIVAGAYRIVERAVAPFLNAFVVATPGIADYFRSDKTIVVQNFPVIAELSQENSQGSTTREPMVVYIGGITEARGALEMVAAMSMLPADSRLQLVLGGRVASESLSNKLQSMPGSERTTLLGVLNRRQVADYLARGSVGLVVLHPEPNYIDSYPVKLFEYMAAGLPVVASNFPFWKQFVEDTGAGVMVDPLDPGAIAQAVVQIVSDPDVSAAMGAAGARVVRERFNWDTEAEKLVKLTTALVGKERKG